MKKYIKAMIKKSKENPDTQITAFILEGFAEQGFEIVSKKDLKKNNKKIKWALKQINELVNDNWQIAMRLYEAGLATTDPENTNVAISSSNSVNPITTQAETAGLRQGAEANEQEAISAIMNSLDAHINKMTKVLDDANYTRIKAELDEMEAILDEPMEDIKDPALDEAVDLYMYYIEMNHTPYQARLMAMLYVKEKVEESEYDHYWIDVYNNLKLLKFTI